MLKLKQKVNSFEIESETVLSIHTSDSKPESDIRMYIIKCAKKLAPA